MGPSPILSVIHTATISTMLNFNGVFPLPDSYADSYFDSYSDYMQKGSTGTDSNSHSDAKLL